MGTIAAIELSSCCGAESENVDIKRDIDVEVKTPILNDVDSPHTARTTDTLSVHQDPFQSSFEDIHKSEHTTSATDTIVTHPNLFKSAFADINKSEYNSRRKQFERRTKSVDTHFLSKPKVSPLLVRAKSETIVSKLQLSKEHRERINKKRKSTMFKRRKKKDENLPLRIHQLWSIFTQYIAESEAQAAADDSESDAADVFATEITYDQYNIILNNHDIHLPPDLPPVLIWELLQINDMLTQEVMTMGLQKDQVHDNPLKERGFHQKQFKVIFKTKITYEMIKCLMEKLNDERVLSPSEKVRDPKRLSYKKRNLVIWHKIIQHLLRKKAFHVEDDYLYGVLQADVLCDLTKIIEILSTKESHWKHKIQIMKYIDRHDNILTDITDEQFTALLTAWSVQLKDLRSAVARVAVLLLPTVLSSLVLSVAFPAILFDRDTIIDPMYDGMFCVIKNKRMKDLVEDAYDAFIQITDICAEIAADFDDDEALQMIVSILEDHSDKKVEKHSNVREACVTGIEFVLFGIENAAEEDSMEAIDENNEIHTDKEDTKEEDDNKDIKLADEIQRKYLLKNEAFIVSFGNILEHGVTDKEAECRKKAFQLLHKLENYPNQNLLEEMGSKWNYTVHKKYNNYKKMEERKNTKRASAKKRRKGKKHKKKNNTNSINDTEKIQPVHVNIEP